MLNSAHIRRSALHASGSSLFRSAPVHLLALAALTAYYLALSWRRWPDPLVDFGFDLYRAWRIAQGAVLYRDVDTFYGPLSQYINAGIFAVFGSGIMHLVWVNLAVFGVILVTLYGLLRRAWASSGAFVGCAVFVSVFGFSQFVGVSAYTYAAPYTHEATHGVLVLLLLLAVLARWLENPDRLGGFLAGILVGLTAVLKLEILFAALLLTIAAAALHRQRKRRFVVWTVVAWAAGAVLPTLLFFGYFLKHLSLRDAWDAACHAWLEFSATAALAGGPVQMGFLGFDRPWANLIEHVEAVFIAVTIIAAVLALGRKADRVTGRLTCAAITIVTVAAAAGTALWAVCWLNVGRCLLGLMALYLMWCLLAVFRCRTAASTKVRDLRVLSAILAVALLASMALNGRIYQYGFYQAAMAGAILPAILLGESADWVGAQRRGRRLIMAAFLVLLLGGTVTLTVQSQRMWSSKTYAVGEGPDRFNAFPPEVSRMAQTVRLLTQVVSQRAGDRTLLVLPDGWMVNYLSRRPSPLAPFIFFSVAMEHGREGRLVNELARRPPDLVIVISRDLNGYGIQRYGESVGNGQLLLQWVVANYAVLARVSPNPSDPTRFRAVVLRRNGIQASEQSTSG